MSNVIKIMKQVYYKINNQINKRNIFIGLLIATVLLLLPMIIVSFYSHPSADDYNYGIFTMNVFKEKGIIALIEGMFKSIYRSYNMWQGTFSAVALFSLNPSVLGHNFYFLTTIIVLSVFFVSVFMLFNQILYKSLKVDKIVYYIVEMIFTMICIQTIPDKTQAFYWWNGASYYMIFFSLELIEIALLIKVYIYNKETKINRLTTPLLVLFISGGNYITALQQIIVLFLLNIYLLFVKKDKSALHLLVIAILGLGVSAIAPGNKYRARMLSGMSPLKSIFMSFVYAWRKTIEWFKPLNIFIILIMVLMITPYYENTNYKFKCPLLVILLSYCIFAAEFTPTLYSTASIGEGRLWNIMYISFLLLLFLNLIYIVGFFRRKLVENNVIKKGFIKKTYKILSLYNVFFISFVVLFISVNVYNNKFYITSYSCYFILHDNQARVYDMEYKERIKLLEDNNIKDVEFKEFSKYPYPLFYSDVGEDINDWRNVPIATIYNKNSVKLVRQKEGN